jgi:hypothetical protein
LAELEVDCLEALATIGRNPNRMSAVETKPAPHGAGLSNNGEREIDRYGVYQIGDV